MNALQEMERRERKGGVEPDILRGMNMSWHLCIKSWSTSESLKVEPYISCYAKKGTLVFFTSLFNTKLSEKNILKFEHF